MAGGRAIEQAAAGRFIGVGLELGGNDPAYVREDANLGHAVETLVDGAFSIAGSPAAASSASTSRSTMTRSFSAPWR